MSVRKLRKRKKVCNMKEREESAPLQKIMEKQTIFPVNTNEYETDLPNTRQHHINNSCGKDTRPPTRSDRTVLASRRNKCSVAACRPPGTRGTTRCWPPLTCRSEGTPLFHRSLIVSDYHARPAWQCPIHMPKWSTCRGCWAIHTDRDSMSFVLCYKTHRVKIPIRMR